MNREEAEKVLNAIDFKDGDNIVIINKNVYDKMKNEKQQLISFLEDKIKLCDKDIKEFSKNRNAYFRIIEDTKMCKRTYQDVLDFFKKGDK